MQHGRPPGDGGEADQPAGEDSEGGRQCQGGSGDEGEQRKNVINPLLRLETFQTNFGSSMTVTVSNFSKSALSAVRTSTAAGEV